MARDILQLAAPGVQGLHPYQPGKPISELEREYGVSDIIKLASNENPLGSSPLALAALAEAVNELALYPDANGFELKQALAAKHDIAMDCITLGNGSNDVLVLLAEAFLTAADEAVFSEYCFAVYPIAVQAAGAQARVAKALPETASMPLGHDLQALAELITEQTRLVFIANPNNPTGTWLDRGALQDFVAQVPDDVLVVIDEAYHEYAGADSFCDATQWLTEYPNLVVTRTFSKAYGLAGLRIGYALSSAEIAGVLNRVRQPFNVNALGLVAARAALDDQAFLLHSKQLNDAGIKQLTLGLQALGYGVVPSAGNFVLANMHRAADEIYQALLTAGLIVRPVANYGLPQHLRISVGTQHQNQQLLNALAEFQRASR